MTTPIPTADTDGGAAPVLSFSPVVLHAPDRTVDLHLRVSAPATGTNLPILLLSHGHGPSNYVSSLYGYAPLANFYAAHGFVVIQPTHLDSATLGLRGADDPQAPLYWRSRAEDMSQILDNLDAVEAAVPQLRGRADGSSVAAIGHSLGGHTVSLLLGARLTDPENGREVNLIEPRVKAGVLLAAPGRGGDALSEFASANYSFFSTTDFSHMSTPTLVVAGDSDDSPHLTVAGPGWHADPYHLAPGSKTLLTIFGAEHGLGGVAGYDLAETTDENPERVAAIQWLTWGYLRHELYPESTDWETVRDSLTSGDGAVGRVEAKQGERVASGA
jgi:predicted dienelactone hydrolase